ncbi:MAG: hypothetical protein ABEJ31_04795 [Haloarculaceae archaeon]
MKSPSLGQKPSTEHILWTTGREQQIKRFHEDQLRRWCDHYGFDFDTYERVDHARSDDHRTQYRCVFSYSAGEGDSISVGDEEWDIQTERIPRTFVEIDEEGIMRLQGWSVERILDVRQLWYDGPVLVVRAAGEDGRQRLDARQLTP